MPKNKKNFKLLENEEIQINLRKRKKMSRSLDKTKNDDDIKYHKRYSKAFSSEYLL